LAFFSLIFGLAAIGFMVGPILMTKMDHPTDPKPLLAVALGAIALLLGFTTIARLGAKSALVGLILGSAAAGWGGSEMYRRISNSNAGSPPPGAENAMIGIEGIEIGGGSSLDVSGMQEEAAPQETKPLETPPVSSPGEPAPAQAK